MFQKFQVTLIQNKLYLIADDNPPKDVLNAFYFNIDNDLIYEPFFEDFGPINLANIWKYVNEVHKVMSSPQYEKCVLFHYTSPHYKKCSNSVLLICAYQMIMINKSAHQAYQPFQKIKLTPFRDASYGKCSYQLTVLECLKGLEYGMQLDWFSFKRFNLNQYEHLQQPQNGNLTWIVPQKLIAFSSPFSAPKNHPKNQNDLLSPKQYLPILKELEVKTVIRLNSPTYNREQFIQNGIDHHDLYYTDGTPPNIQIVQKFLSIVQNTQGVVAVHCKAGLGRTGCLIAVYAMKNYKFQAAHFLGWIRLCRPGSILGPQQHFLLEIEFAMHRASETPQTLKQVEKRLNEKGIASLKSEETEKAKQKKQMSEEEKCTALLGEKGQGKRLIEAKSKKYQKQRVPQV